MFGQMRTSKSPAPGVVADWKAKHGDTQEIEDAFLKLPYQDDEQLQHIAKLFSVLVDYITSQSLVSLQGNLLIEKITTCMTERLDQTITLNQISNTFHKSPSTISHAFKKATDKSFKTTLIELRLEKADKIFRAEPDATVTEVASRLGYDDPFYFSRIYSKYRGHPPSKGRERETETPR